MCGHACARTHRHTSGCVMCVIKGCETIYIQIYFMKSSNPSGSFHWFVFSNLYVAFFSSCTSALLRTRAGGALNWAKGHYKTLAVLASHTHTLFCATSMHFVVAVYVRKKVLLGFKISHPAVKNLCLLLTLTMFLWCHWLTPHPRRLPNSAGALAKRLPKTTFLPFS